MRVISSNSTTAERDFCHFTDTGQSTGTYNEGEPHPIGRSNPSRRSPSPSLRNMCLPIAWCQHSNAGSLPVKQDSPGAGRSFYTSLGHLNSTWQDETFQQHLMNGLLWALDGKTTRAYNANALVGNATLSENSASTTTSATSAATSSASQSSGTSSARTTGTQSQ